LGKQKKGLSFIAQAFFFLESIYSGIIFETKVSLNELPVENAL
jgi:hypothetical protein